MNRYTYKSFTLIELLVVVGILAILSAATIPSYVGFSKERSIDRVAAALSNDIQLVRNKALSGALQNQASPLKTSAYWTLRVTCSGTTLQRNAYRLGFTDADGTFVEVTKRNLSTDYYFSTTAVGTGTCASERAFDFERLTGNLKTAPAAVDIYVVGLNNGSRHVVVSASGNININ